VKDCIHIGIVTGCGGIVTGCGGLPIHRHHYLRRVSAATTLDNTMRYTVYIKYILQHYNKVHLSGHLYSTLEKISTPINSS